MRSEIRYKERQPWQQYAQPGPTLEVLNGDKDDIDTKRRVLASHLYQRLPAALRDQARLYERRTPLWDGTAEVAIVIALEPLPGENPDELHHGLIYSDSERWGKRPSRLKVKTLKGRYTEAHRGFYPATWTEKHLEKAAAKLAEALENAIADHGQALVQQRRREALEKGEEDNEINAFTVYYKRHQLWEPWIGSARRNADGTVTISLSATFDPADPIQLSDLTEALMSLEDGNLIVAFTDTPNPDDGMRRRMPQLTPQHWPTEADEHHR